MAFNYSNFPAIESLRTNRDINPAQMQDLQRGITEAVRNRDITTPQRVELRRLIEHWLKDRQNVELTTKNSLDAMHRDLESGVIGNVTENMTRGASVLSSEVSTRANDGFNYVSRQVSENMGPENSVLKRVGILAALAVGTNYLVVKPIKWLIKKFQNAPYMTTFKTLGLGALAALGVGVMGWRQERRDTSDAERLAAPPDEQQQLEALRALSGVLTSQQVENLNLFAPQLRGRLVQLAPQLQVGFADGQEGTTQATHIQVNNRLFGMTATGPLGNISTSASAQPASLRMQGNEVVLSLDGGRNRRIITREDFVTALNSVKAAPAGNADVPVQLRVRQQRNVGQPETITVTFRPVTSPTAPTPMPPSQL